MMIQNQESIVYLSETYKAELFKTLIFVGSAGFFGGVLNCKVQKYFTRIVDNQATSFLKLVIQYIGNGLIYSFSAVALVYSFFWSSPIESMKMVKTINQFSVPIAILFPSVLAAINEVLSKTIFRRNEN